MPLEIRPRLAGEGAPSVAMTSEQLQRVKELFAALEPLSAQERQRTLEARCGGDPVVRAELEKLLEPKDGVAGRTDGIRSVGGGAREMTGQRVGPYEVV